MGGYEIGNFEDMLKMDYRSVFTLQPLRSVTYFGVGAIEKIKVIAEQLKKKGIDKVMIVTDPTVYKETGVDKYIKPALESNNIEFVMYDKVRPNPTYEGCDEVANIAKEEGVKAVISVGGGSHHDTAKTAAALLKHPHKTAKELYEKIIIIYDAIPIISINTTHGTGSEVDGTAVAQSDSGYKPAIVGPALYPTFTIEDPALTVTLPNKQTISTSLDAFHHSFESLTAKTRNPYNSLLALKAVGLISKWLPVARVEPNNIVARYWLMYASVLAGIAFDNTGLHLTHVLEHPMSALNPKVPHGVGLTAIFPEVLKVTYNALPEISAEALRPIIPELKGVPGEAEYAAKRIEKWFANVGCPEKLRDLGFTENDIPRLVENTMTSPMSPLLFNLAPVPVTEDLVRKIYEGSLDPISKE